jgi:hypothetical protein
MKIVSFDVGIVNLAYCIIETVPEPKILHWEIIELAKRGNTFSAHIASSGISELYLTLINQLDKRPHLLETDVVLIEKQPSFNPKMRIIAGCLQTYFYIRGVVDKAENKIGLIEFFSPKNKLKCYTGPELDISSKNGKVVKGKYAQTKKMGVMIAKFKLEEYTETDFIPFFESSKKKDDLSDCYLQALTYIGFKQSKPSTKTKETKEIKMTKSSRKKQMKDYLDSLVKNCSVMEIMEKNYRSIHEITFPFKLLEGSIEKVLESLSMKKYLNYKYLN